MLKTRMRRMLIGGGENVPNVPVMTHRTGLLHTEIEAGTSCPCGGDAGHGGRTIVTFSLPAGSEVITHLNRVELIIGGDMECTDMIEALEFAASAIKFFQEGNR
jgi:hypothetical protein